MNAFIHAGNMTTRERRKRILVKEDIGVNMQANRITSISPHSVHPVAVRLWRQASALSEGPASGTLNIVAKTSQPSSVLCFQEALPVEVLFDEGAEIDPEGFCVEWGEHWWNIGNVAQVASVPQSI